MNELQQRVNEISIPWIKSLHIFKNVPKDFKPWESNLSPSALYSCSLPHRKSMGHKAHEVKWMSVKRWVTQTPSGITLPPGVCLSIKRKEEFVAMPIPKFQKKEFMLMMFPYGNVWSQISSGDPITEEWLFSESGGKLILEILMLKDAAKPVVKYFESCYKYMLANPDQIGIHLKRKQRNLNQ